MADIDSYYKSDFRSDLHTFMADRTVPYFGHSWEVSCDNLNLIPNERRVFFLICLYFTVLVDQAMHANFRSHYEEFESLTKYPKFCHGLDQFQKNPRALLYVPVDKSFVDKTEMGQHLKAGMRLFVAEVKSFFEQHLPQVSYSEFLEKLIYDRDVQIPKLTVLVDPSVKENIDYIAYEALVEATEELKGKFT
jgi:hypothetical protein